MAEIDAQVCWDVYQTLSRIRRFNHAADLSNPYGFLVGVVPEKNRKDFAWLAGDQKIISEGSLFDYLLQFENMPGAVLINGETGELIGVQGVIQDVSRKRNFRMLPGRGARHTAAGYRTSLFQANGNESMPEEVWFTLSQQMGDIIGWALGGIVYSTSDVRPGSYIPNLTKNDLERILKRADFHFEQNDFENHAIGSDNAQDISNKKAVPNDLYKKALAVAEMFAQEVEGDGSLLIGIGSKECIDRTFSDLNGGKKAYEEKTGVKIPDLTGEIDSIVSSLMPLRHEDGAITYLTDGTVYGVRQFVDGVHVHDKSEKPEISDLCHDLKYDGLRPWAAYSAACKDVATICVGENGVVRGFIKGPKTVKCTRKPEGYRLNPTRLYVPVSYARVPVGCN